MTNILWTIVAVILAIWLVGLLLDVVGGLIHILLIVAVALVIYNVIAGRSRV